ARLGRREFLFGSSLAIATAVAPALGASKGSTVPLDARALAELSATTATAAMRAGELKAEDYANALLDQAERNKDLNAFRTLHPDKVREMARDADRRRRSGMSLGALHGLPIPVKDSVNTKNLPTSNGTRALRDFHPRDDAAILKPLYAAGAFAMGKTNLHELSCGWTSNNATFGPVLNPFDRRRTPGGSSGGRRPHRTARNCRRHLRIDPCAGDVLWTCGTQSYLRPLLESRRHAARSREVRSGRRARAQRRGSRPIRLGGDGHARASARGAAERGTHCRAARARRFEPRCGRGVGGRRSHRPTGT